MMERQNKNVVGPEELQYSGQNNSIIQGAAFSGTVDSARQFTPGPAPHRAPFPSSFLGRL